MCILFAFWVRNPSPEGYRLILAANRDEYFRRQTAKAASWPDAPHIFGGMDMEPGSEGGTWLGMDTREGRIGALLNVSGYPAKTPNPVSRGHLVSDWLRQNSPPSEYLTGIARNGSAYNGFHVVTFDLSPTGGVAHVSNSDTDGVRFLPEGIVSVGNSVFDRPLRKVKAGRHRFQEIVDRLGNKGTEQELIDELSTFLKWDEEHFPDPELEVLTTDEQINRRRSCVFQRHATFGTRTHTIILVDADWKCQFHEWTLQEPIEVTTSSWLYTNKAFALPYEN